MQNRKQNANAEQKKTERKSRVQNRMQTHNAKNRTEEYKTECKCTTQKPETAKAASGGYLPYLNTVFLCMALSYYILLKKAMANYAISSRTAFKGKITLKVVPCSN